VKEGVNKSVYFYKDHHSLGRRNFLKMDSSMLWGGWRQGKEKKDCEKTGGRKNMLKYNAEDYRRKGETIG